MAVEVTTYFSGPFITNGATTVFPFTFISMDGDEIGVLLRDADGVDTIADTADYSVTRAADGTGSVVYASAPATGYDLYIFSDVSFAQSVEFEDGSGWKAAPVNSVADRSAARDIWLKGRVDRALLAPLGEVLAALPSSDARLGKFLAFDAEGNPVAADGTGPDGGLRSDLAASGGSALTGFIQSGAGATSRAVQNKLRDFASVKDYGATGDGTTNDRAAFIAVASGQIYVPPGTYLVSADTTITAQLQFAPGAILKPASGVKINLEHIPLAGIHQIFDRSAGGAVQFVNSGTPEVYVEWWGAEGGTGGRTDNEVPIQWAIDSVQSVIYADFTTKAPNADNNGGVVKFGKAAEYLCSGRIHTRNNVVLRGLGQFTVLKANAGTWGSDTELWLSQNGSASQFGCRAEMMQFNSSYITGVRTIYAPAWQQNCGLRDCIVTGFKATGLKFDNAYGGSVGWEIENTLFSYTVASASNATKCIDIDIDGIYTVGWMNVTLDNVQFESDATTLTGVVDQMGLSVKGRVKVNASAIHMEGVAYGIVLDKDASLYGQMISPSGNNSVKEVIQVLSTWTGKIDVTGVTKAGATYLLNSYISGATKLYRDVDPIFGRIVYPNDPTEVLAYAKNTTNAGSLDSTAFGFSGITRNGAGDYTLTYDATKFAPITGTHVRELVSIGTTTGRTYYVSAYATGSIRLIFKDLSAVSTDTDTFEVRMYGKPGY